MRSKDWSRRNVEHRARDIVDAIAGGKILDMDESVVARFPAVPWASIRVDATIIWETIAGDDLKTLAEAVDQLSRA